MRQLIGAFILIGGARTRPAHQQAKLSQLFVIDKELARHGALVTQHVNQKTQSAQAIAQFLEGLLALAFVCGLVDHQALDRLAHTQHRNGCLVQAQHR